MEQKAPCFAAIAGIRSYLPSRLVTNEELSSEVGWTADQILAKTGIACRHISAPGECVSDMGTAAAQRLIVDLKIDPASVDFLIFCTQTPDHFLPATACLVQNRLGLPSTCAAFDINQGCSGYIYSLSVANAFIRSGVYRHGLVITSDTYSKYINPKDRSVRTIFGDAATATWVRRAPAPGLGEFVLGTDGKGACNLIIPAGGTRRPKSSETAVPVADASGNMRSQDDIYMNGPEIFSFTLQRVPEVVAAALAAGGLRREDIAWYVLHQANKFMLDHLSKKMGLPSSQMYYYLENVGNTVSCSIPLALEHGAEQGHFLPGQKLLLVGFGVGYSWGAATLTWTGPTA